MRRVIAAGLLSIVTFGAGFWVADLVTDSPEPTTVVDVRDTGEATVTGCLEEDSCHLDYRNDEWHIVAIVP